MISFKKDNLFILGVFLSLLNGIGIIIMYSGTSFLDFDSEFHRIVIPLTAV